MTAPAYIRAGSIAGIVGGAVNLAFNVASIQLGPAGPLGPATIAMMQFVAAVAVGKETAYSSPWFALLGVAIHFVVSVCWATGFAYLAQTRRYLLTRAATSGIGYGMVVWFMMQLVMMAAGMFHNPSPPEVFVGLVSDCIFFGVPVAAVAARAMR